MFIQKENFGNSETIINSNKAAELEKFIRSNVKVAEFMDIHVAELSECSVRLTAPLDSNINHYGTAFGGSLSTLGIVSGWALIQYKISEEKISARLAIQESKTKYIAPAIGDFEATINSLPNEVWDEFISEFNENGKSKIRLLSHLYSDGNLVAVHEGVYAAVKNNGI